MPKGAKQVNSLLLVGTGPQDTCESLGAQFEEIASRHGVPAHLIELTVLESHLSKYTFDFSNEIDQEPEYDLFLSNFLRARERFLVELLGAESMLQFSLSALIAVDESLAAFELKSPKIPAKISELDNFAFDYFVWHVAT